MRYEYNVINSSESRENKNIYQTKIRLKGQVPNAYCTNIIKMS